MSNIKRYTIFGTPGGYQEREDETGEWVRYEDVKKVIANTGELKEAITYIYNNVEGTESVDDKFADHVALAYKFDTILTKVFDKSYKILQKIKDGGIVV